MIKKLMSHLHLAAATLLLFGGLSLAAVGPSSPVLAATVDVLEKCDSKSKVCKGTDENSLFNLLKNVINLLLIVSGIIAVIMIIIGGIRYSVSGGDSSQTKSAKDTIIYAVVGLVIAVMSFAIVNFILGKV